MSRRAMSSVLQHLAIILSLMTATRLAASDVGHEDKLIKVAGSPDVPVAVFTVDPARSRIRVLTPQDLSGAPVNHHGVSVREAETSPIVGKVIAKHALLFNGGFSESNTDVPAGLLVSDGAVVSLASYATKRADPTSTCPFRRQDRPRMSGVFCVSQAGAVSIEDLQGGSFGMCRQAVQSGPLLVEKVGEPAVCPDDSESTPRTAVCIRSKQLLVVVTAAPISLHALATWLAAPADGDGLGCERALNLSGDASSGAVYFPGGLASIRNRFKVGQGRFPLPSLILVQSRTIP